MLARYKIYRGKLPEGVRLPGGIRQDTRKHTRHFLRPPAEAVSEYLANPSTEAWTRFRSSYLRNLQDRWESDRMLFDNLASLASHQDVYIGCSCPTARNPDVRRCHTTLALKFMKDRYPALEVELP